LNVEAWGDHDEYDPLDHDYASGSGSDDDDSDGDGEKKRKIKKSRRVSLSPSCPKIPKPSDLERVAEELTRHKSNLAATISSCITVKSESSIGTEAECHNLTEAECHNLTEAECHNLSIALWGLSCSPPPGCSWSVFLNSRLSTPSPHLPTQHALLQERFANDGWMLLCACVLMTRCSSSKTKESCIGGFFKICPKPSDFANLDPEKLRKTVHSLGFQVDRVRSLAAVTTAWLTRGEFGLDLVPEEKGGMKIWGAGAFTVDSYYLFAKGDKDWKMLCDIDDVKWFRGWLRASDKMK
jgi:hypothetical protein